MYGETRGFGGVSNSFCCVGRIFVEHFLCAQGELPTADVDYGFCYPVNRQCLDCRLLTFRLEGLSPLFEKSV